MSGDFFKLMMAIKFNFPAELSKLLGKAGFNEMNRTLVDTWLRLQYS